MRALVFFIWLLPTVSFGFGVTDRAGFFTPERVATAQDRLARLYSRYNEDVTIDTYDKPMKPISGDRSKFFSTLAINAAPNKGVYIMIFRTPGHLEVVSTSKYVSTGDRANIANVLTSQFKNKNFDNGLLDALDSIETAYSGVQNTPAAPKVATTVVAAPAVEHTGTSLWWYFGVILIAGALFLFIRRLFSVGERPPTGGGGGGESPAGYSPVVHRDSTTVVVAGGGASAGDTMLAAGVGSSCEMLLTVLT